MTNLNEIKVKELKEMAKNLGVKDWWKLKKDDLMNEIAFAISENEQSQPEDVEEVIADEVIVKEKKVSQNDSEKKPRGKMIEYNGKSQSLNGWAKELGMPGQTLFARLYISNWPVEKAFTTPSRRKKNEEEA
jgi:hypothetical protein